MRDTGSTTTLPILSLTPLPSKTVHPVVFPWTCHTRLQHGALSAELMRYYEVNKSDPLSLSVGQSAGRKPCLTARNTQGNAMNGLAKTETRQHPPEPCCRSPSKTGGGVVGGQRKFRRLVQIPHLRPEARGQIKADKQCRLPSRRPPLRLSFLASPSMLLDIPRYSCTGIGLAMRHRDGVRYSRGFG